MLEIKNLKATIDKNILKGLDLILNLVKFMQLWALMVQEKVH